MDLLPLHLETLAAIADHGTFESAAAALAITPSAVSQRIKALERVVGQLVVRRTSPAEVTPAGEVLLGLARRQALLMAEAGLLLGTSTTRQLPVAVNADSLATWFRDVLSETANWEDAAIRVFVEDQAYSAELLRSGQVLAAVTSDPTPVQGCSVAPLGRMRYYPVAAAELAARWHKGRSYDWQRMPVVQFNEKDDLQHSLLREYAVTSPSVVHRVPTSADFAEAVYRGLGWGVLPEVQARDRLAEGTLVPLMGRRRVSVDLWWVRWRLDSPLLDELTDAVRRIAAASLSSHG